MSTNKTHRLDNTSEGGPDSQRSIIKSMSLLSVGTFSSRILGFMRDIILAKLLGTGIRADAFFVALKIPNLFRDFVGEGATNAAVVPVFDPFVNNVINCNLGLPMFTYCPAAAMGFTIPSLPWPGAPCPNMSAMPRTSLPAGPRRTRVVLIRIQTQTQNRDPQTGQFYTVEFFNVAQRVNPDQ